MTIIVAAGSGSGGGDDTDGVNGGDDDGGGRKKKGMEMEKESPVAPEILRRESELMRVEVPRIELNNATRTREPLLMTLMELERLLLGCQGFSNWREQRMGMTKDEYVGMELGTILPLAEKDAFEPGLAHGPSGIAPKASVRSGLLHWAAPFSGGAATAAVERVHPDGCVDVRLARDRCLLRRVPLSGYAPLKRLTPAQWLTCTFKGRAVPQPSRADHYRSCAGARWLATYDDDAP